MNQCTRLVKEEVHVILEKFDIENKDGFIESSSVNILCGKRSFKSACYRKGLGHQINVHQIKAFFEYMNHHRCSTSSIRSQYKGIEKMAAELKGHKQNY